MRGGWHDATGLVRRLTLVLASLLASAARRAFAQGTTGSINGTVTDNTGAVLPGVTVTATGPAIMGAQTAVTNEQGQYRFPSLPPGTYRLEYQLAGFSTVVREGIVVSIGFAATINVQLQVAHARRNRHRHRRVAGRRHAEHATSRPTSRRR